VYASLYAKCLVGGGGDWGGARYARLDQGEIYKNKGTKGYNMT
jgi:hypothetical protein